MTFGDFDFDFLNGKLTHLFNFLLPWTAIAPVFFLRMFVFDVKARTGQTDGRTDGRARCAMRPVGRPHNTWMGVCAVRVLLVAVLCLFTLILYDIITQVGWWLSG